jgi:hypothetical protein
MKRGSKALSRGFLEPALDERFESLVEPAAETPEESRGAAWALAKALALGSLEEYLRDISDLDLWVGRGRAH